MFSYIVILPNPSASYANVLTILSFSLERYLVICKPMNLSILPFSDLTRAGLVLAICWMVAMAAAVPYHLSTRCGFTQFS